MLNIYIYINMSYSIQGIINVNRLENGYTITLSKTNMGSDQDKFLNAFEKTMQEVLEDGPIYDIVRLKPENELNYQEGEMLAKHLTVMVSHLLLEGFALYSLSVEDIYVINNSKYLFTNPERCVPVTPAKRIIQPTNHARGTYIAPELVSLPSRTPIDRATSNWCIGALLMQMLFQSQDQSKLLQIKETSLYYFIARSLDKNVELREVLYM